jgi:hypothetical protein
MNTLKRRIIVTTIATACALAITPVLTASASPTPTQHFMSVQTSIDGPQTVVAAGPVSGTGTDTQLSNHRDQFVFPNGTLTVRHESGSVKQTFDAATCVGTVSETGTYVIARGTGVYAHATGSGSYKAFVLFQGCSHDEPPESFAFTIVGHGPLTLG